MADRDETLFRASVEDLKQRGGRTLSPIDLIDAGTLDLDSAAYLCARIQEGASYFTAAMPGNAGKTTILAALLAAIPPGERIVTVSDERSLTEPCAGPVTWLAEEVQDAPFLGYLWGPAVAHYFGKIGNGERVVSCMHADDLPQMTGILCSEPNSVSEEQLLSLGLILFLRMTTGPEGIRRRVSSIMESDGHQHREVYRWDGDADRHVQVGELQGDLNRRQTCRTALESLLNDGRTNWVRVRNALAGSEHLVE